MSRSDTKVGSLIAGAIASILLVVIVVCAACWHIGSHHGACVGFGEDFKRVPGVHYELSVSRIVIGVVGFETVVLPLYVALRGIYCPV